MCAIILFKEHIINSRSGTIDSLIKIVFKTTKDIAHVDAVYTGFYLTSNQILNDFKRLSTS